MMSQSPYSRSHRNSGIKNARAREARRLVRDRKIYRIVRERVAEAMHLHEEAGVPVDPLSVYTGRPDIEGFPRLTPFPIVKQDNRRATPQWEDLSQWMKVQVVTMAYAGDFLTFNIHIHSDLERKWELEGTNPLTAIRDRLRKEMDKALGIGREWFFVIEGWSKVTKSPTFLHIHGGAALREPTDAKKIEIAAARAAGHDQRGRPRLPRTVHTAEFKVEQAAYANYLFKSVRRRDPRLPERRFAISNSLTSTARLFWETITREVPEWREPV
jgi:hypothetical protein